MKPDLAAQTEDAMRAAALQHLIDNGSWLTAEQLAGDIGSGDSNSFVTQWIEKGTAFAVNFNGQDLLAAYQFDTAMKPRPIIAGLLEALGKSDPWKIAAWFGSANGWLRGKRPQDCLDDPATVLEAAKREADGFEG